MDQEIELKLSLAPEIAAALTRSGFRRLAQAIPGIGRPGRARRLDSQYFDTPDLWLSRHGMALRLRRIGGRIVQTLKAPIPVSDRAPSGLQIYRECEAALPAAMPNLAAIDDAALRRRLQRAGIWPRLKPLFRTRFDRLTLDWASENTRIEIALDRGGIEAGGARRMLSEMELELKSGDPLALFRLAERLIEEIPARLGGATKAARGYDLFLNRRPMAEKARPVLIPDGASAADAFVAIMRNGIEQLRANEAALLAEGSPNADMASEAVHQFRVATRRMRALIGAYRATIDDDALAMMSIDLRWLQRQFGLVRDLDVMIAETLRPVASGMKGLHDLEPLIAIAIAARRAAAQGARLALDNPRYGVMLLQFYRHLAEGSWRLRGEAGAALDLPARRFAAALLKKRHKSLLRLGGRHADLNEAELHRLRISAKKMRYAAEAFAGLYKTKAVKRYLAALVAIQDRLGGLNDAFVGRALLDRSIARLTQDGKMAKDKAQLLHGIVLGWQARRIATDLAGFSDIWHAFLEQKRFWR